MRKVCFVPIGDSHYYPEGCHIFVNSFKRFHPDIDLVVFRQNTIDKVFSNPKINWFNAKPFFAELLEDDYDLICNIDADTIILDRLTEVFDKVDYEVGSVWNYNSYENASFDNITEKQYVQAGMVASTSKEFWKIWREENKKAMLYLRKENDILNLVYWNNPIVKKMKRKIFDKNKNYLGCKSLGREPEFTIGKDGKTYLRGEIVKSYHFARGNTFPKLDIFSMPLIDEVRENWNQIATFGQSVKITNI